ncbi:MAG: DUF4097 family beta strand repeat protein [Deferribacteres bacterium]|nr:DUF4097 family beta strand repeat protein [Deferribacteres bacterium]
MHFTQGHMRRSNPRSRALQKNQSLLYWLGFWLTLTACAFYSTASAGTGDSKEFRQTVDLNKDGRLRMETYKGSIKLTSWDKNQVEIYARIEPGDNVSSQYAVESVEATKIDIYGSGSTVTIRSDYDDVPSDRSWLFGQSRNVPYVHYEIKAPRTARIQIDDHKSEISISDFSGTILVESYKGIVEAENLSGESIFDSHKGEFRLTGIRGNIEVNNYKGEVYLSAEKLDGRSRLETYKGRIEVRLPKNLAFTLSADIGDRGDFRSDFEINQRRDWRDDRDDYYIEQEINGGGPGLYFKTGKGSIRLIY